MSTRNLTLTVAIALLASVFCAFRSATASVWSDTQREVPADSAAALQLKWVIEANADSASQVVEIRRQVPRNMMAYQFRVEVTYAGADDASMDVPQWEGELRRGRDGNGAIHRFTNDQREWRLPSLWSVPLAADEQVVLTVRLSKAESRRLVVRLAIDHEQLDRQGSRRAIQPVLAEAGMLTNTQNTIYEWKSDVDGYLLGISDLWRPSSADVSLIDVTTGATLWSDSAHGSASFDAPTSTRVQTLYLPQVAGHLYQFIVSPKAAARAQAGQPAATMMVRASRAYN